jgi:tetratricopeptide (TPR) repeat protein
LYLGLTTRPWRIGFAGGLVGLAAVGALLLGGVGRSSSAAPSAPAAPAPPESAELYLDRGNDFLERGQWAAAVAAYADAVRLEPRLLAAHVGAAQALVFSHRYDEAIRWAEQAVALAPSDATARAVLALAHNWNGDTARALAEARRATILAPDLAVAHAYVAEAYADQFKLDEAQAAIDRALALDADDPEVARVSGYLLEARQQYLAAAEEYQRAIDLQPRWGHLYIALGHAFRVLRRYAEAEAAFIRATEVAPDDPRGEGGLGMTAFDQERYAEAVEHFERAVQIDPTYATGYGQLGVIAYQRRDYARAQPLFERAIELERNAVRNASYRHALGWIYLRSNQPAEARAQFTKALELNPALQGAREGLAALGQR